MVLLPNECILVDENILLDVTRKIWSTLFTTNSGRQTKIIQ